MGASMSAMREAFEKWWNYARDKNFNSKADFDAGWQACMEHIKERLQAVRDDPNGPCNESPYVSVGIDTCIWSIEESEDES